MDELLDAYVDETDTLLEAMNAQLAQLEQKSDDKTVLKALYDHIHTLQNSSDFVGFAIIESFAHRMMDVIGCLKDGTLPVTPDHIALISESIACLKNAIGVLKTSGEEPEAFGADTCVKLQTAYDSRDKSADPIADDELTAHTALLGTMFTESIAAIALEDPVPTPELVTLKAAMAFHTAITGKLPEKAADILVDHIKATYPIDPQRTSDMNNEVDEVLLNFAMVAGASSRFSEALSEPTRGQFVREYLRVGADAREKLCHWLGYRTG